MELINRLEVMDLFETWYCSKCTRACKPTACRACWVDDAIDVIEEATEYFVGDVAPVIHAYWIEDGDDYICSNCNEIVFPCISGLQMDKSLKEGKTYWNYCPHCGAKMGLKKEG